MEYFLQRIARHIHDQYGDDLRDHCMVFPGRRSGLFFLKYLSGEIKKPIWAPEVVTINEFFRSLSGLHPAENELLLFELFKVYRTLTNTTESFDDFYFWGDILLNDFDDTDKYLADASRLYRNVTDLKEIEYLFGGLSEEQVNLVRRFWTNFDPVRSTGAKGKFINIWSVLQRLYSEFRSVLFKKNLAYEGMIFRSVSEDPDLISQGIKWKMVHFTGFNALNECEKKIMHILRDEGKAKFYWDYDNSYIDDKGYNSAGFFLRNNIRIFGNDMPPDWSYNTHMAEEGGRITRRVIETSSDLAQVKLIPQLIGEIPGLDADSAHNTAVVLADENLLIPLLSSLPPEIPDINITMGYPLKQTSAYMLVRQLLSLQRNARRSNGVCLFNHEDVTGILNNELVATLLSDAEKKIPQEIIEQNLIYIPSERFSKSENLSRIFIRNSTPLQLCDYIRNILVLIAARGPATEAAGSMPVSVRNEFIYRIILAINRLRPLTEDSEIKMSVETWTKLLDRILRMQSVPFSGEPLSGIQVMGILETRTLDFKNLIMLSVNEGIMPSATTASSFIPFSLRQAFGLPSLNHQESIYAYHFYRLLHRAENVIYIFNSNPEGLRSGEMSRFLQQLKFEASTAPEFLTLSFEIKNPVALTPVIERSAEHNRRLMERYSSGAHPGPLSPSAISTWLNCRMRFYYRYVNGIREPKQLMTEIDPAALGSMVHSAIRSLYAAYSGKIIDANTISGFIKDKEGLDKVIRVSMNEVLKRETESYMIINELLVGEVLKSYIGRILEMDRITAPFTIVSMEAAYYFPYLDEDLFKAGALQTGGNIDRVDHRNGITRILDYKTGKPADKVRSLSSLFEDDRERDLDAWLQTLIYCEAYLSEVPGIIVRPSVYKLKKMPGEIDSDMMVLGNEPVGDYNMIRNEFRDNLRNLIRTIFSSSESFVMTKNRNKCSYCPYRVLCQR